MIECIFTIDYEIYGNGSGSLRDLVYEPAEKLKTIFEKYGSRFVTFVEAAELEMIEANCADPALDLIKCQLRDLYSKGFELGLHLHPQWYNGHYENGEWSLDYNEYNLCILPQDRINQLIKRSIGYLRRLLQRSDFTPISFRAGNWLLQPTQAVARVLVEHGIKIDSSVYKGGLQHHHNLDYRRAQKNAYYWPFSEDVNVPDPNGQLLELPTYTKMVPFWELFTSKRMSLQQKGASNYQSRTKQLSRFKDFARFRQPLKLDFCRLTIHQLISMLDKEIREDKENPDLYRPIVAIGHTKDLIDFGVIEAVLSHLQSLAIPITLFRNVYDNCNRQS